MSAVETYIQELQNLTDWIPYLIRNSCLPGPRANLELGYAVGRLATLEQAQSLLESDSYNYLDQSPETLSGFVRLDRAR